MEMDHRSLYERTWTRWSFVFYPPKSGKGPERQKSERQKFSLQIRLSTFWYLIWRQKRSEPQKSNFSDFRRSFWRSDFWHSDLLTFHILIIQKKSFDVLTLWHSDFWCSDPLSQKLCALCIFKNFILGKVCLSLFSKLQSATYLKGTFMLRKGRRKQEKKSINLKSNVSEWDVSHLSFLQ